MSDYVDGLVAEINRLRGILALAETTPYSEWATELAAARENVEATALLLREARAVPRETLEQLADWLRENPPIHSLARLDYSAAQSTAEKWKRLLTILDRLID